MGKMLLSIVALLGKVCGTFGRLLPAKMQFLWYVFSRNVVTAKLRGRFKYLGERTLLASDITLLTPQYISIGEGSSVMRHCILETCPSSGNTPDLKIGNGVSLGEYSHITCANCIEIGDGVLTGRFVLITDNGHGSSSVEEIDIPPLLRKVYSSGPVKIGKNVWIGDKVSILPNVTIGEGTVIAANAVVTKDIPAYAVAAGCPAKVVKMIK